VQSLEVIEGAPPAEYGDKTSVVIVATTRSGLVSQADRKHHDFLRDFRLGERGLQPRLRPGQVGQFHRGQRFEHRPFPGRAGIQRDA